MSERTERLDELFAQEIAAIIAREIADPRVGFVTVTKVEVAPDLRHATVWVSVIGDAATQKASLRALGRAMPFVRHRLGALHLRRIPELHLRHDDSVERGTRVLRLIEEIEDGSPGEAVPELAALPAPVTSRGTPEPAAPRRRTRRGPAGAAPGRPGGNAGRGSARAGRGTREGRGARDTEETE
ncbi:MAG: 30S ribosome-binding factor RbfA [Chloroflexota bacterium]